MSRPTQHIIKDIEKFDSIRDGWPTLDCLVNELKASPTPARGIDALLGVFERGVTSGSGILMTVLHMLEGLPGYEIHVVDSMRRMPSVLAVMMVNRMLNSDITDVGDVPLMQLLANAKADPRCQRAVKEEIEAALEGRPS